MTELIYIAIVIIGTISGFGMMGFLSKSRPKALAGTRYEKLYTRDKKNV